MAAVWPPKNEERNERGKVRCVLHCQPACCSPAHVFCAQGLKRKQVALEKAEARAAKKTAAEERDPQLPTSVPLPKDVSEVQNQHVATLLAEGTPAPAGAAPGAAM